MKSLNFKAFLSVAIILAAMPGTLAIDLRPAYAACQSGGGMGIASAGIGWNYGSKKRWETDIFAGIVPKYDSNSTKVTIAIKENFVPWQIKLKGDFYLEPLTTSIYFTTILSKRFWTRLPDRYSPNYYSLPTKIRINIALGQRLRWQLPKQTGCIDSVSAYYELGTCDIYALSAAGNKELKPSDWLQLCIGIRIYFRK